MSNKQRQTTDTSAPLRVRRPYRRWFMLAIIILVLGSHPWWLRAYGEYLVAEETVSPADVAVVLSGDHRLQRAAALFLDRAVSEVWVLEREAGYAVSVGILPPSHTVETEQLEVLGVPEEHVRVLRGGMRDINDAARMITRAVRESPNRPVTILCHRPHGRNLQLVMDQVSCGSPELQISRLGLPPDRFDESNWWKVRTGWKEMFNATCQFVFTVVHGVDAEREPSPWDPDAYERSFVSKYGEAGCGGAE